MSSLRLAPIEPKDAESAELIGKVTAPGARPLNIFATLAHHPLLLRRYVAFGGVFLAFGKLPARERELVILRCGRLSGSEYEFAQHTRIGREAGVTEEEIERVAQPGLAGWPEEDALLLRMVDELRADDRVGEVTWAALAERFDEEQLLELVALAGFYRMTAGILNSAGVELEPGVEAPAWAGR